MTGATHTVMRFLLLSFISTGVNGDDGLILADKVYDIVFPCEVDLVCFHIWQISTGKASESVAIVSNGEIQTAESQEEECSLQIQSLTAKDVGHHRCQQRPDVFSLQNARLAAPALDLMPAKTVSLQCVFLPYVETGQCSTEQLQQLTLTWVDETGAEIQDDSQHQISRYSPCDKALTVTFQHPENRKFRCQATVDEQVQTSVEFQIRALAFEGKGKRILIEVEPEQQGGNQDAVGAAVGVASCAVLTVAAAAFVANRRRTNRLLPTEPCSVKSDPSSGMNTDDVIYADIVLPVHSNRVWFHECESTEYACVR